MINCDNTKDDHYKTRLIIEKLLRSLGANGRLAGFSYMVFIIDTVLQAPDNTLFITKEIYPSTAKAYKTTISSVEKSLRTLIEQIWRRKDHTQLDFIAGFHLEQKPSNGRFIDILTAYIRNTSE